MRRLSSPRARLAVLVVVLVAVWVPPLLAGAPIPVLAPLRAALGWSEPADLLLLGMVLAAVARVLRDGTPERA